MLKYKSVQVAPMISETNASEADISLLEFYFSKFDGSKNAWEQNVKELFPQIFHKDFHFRLNDDESLDYSGWTELVKSFLAKGNRSDLMHLDPLSNNQLLLIIRNTHNQVAEVSKQLVTYKDSKIILVEALPEDSKSVEVLFKSVLRNN